MEIRIPELDEISRKLDRVLALLTREVQPQDLPAQKDRPKLVGIKETAEALGLATSTLYKMTSEGRLPYHKIGRRVLFDLEEIMARLRIKKRR
jgi:excisionase family DNA binding protein